MELFFALTWEGAYHDDSELWIDNDDGTYATPALAFIRNVIQPTLHRVLKDCKIAITIIQLSNGTKLLELSEEADVLEALQHRENQFNAQLNTLEETERSFIESLELPTRSLSVVNFTIVAEGNCEDTSELFLDTNMGIKNISKRLMTELAQQYMGNMCLIGHSRDSGHFIDYGGGYEIGGSMPLWPFQNPYGGNIDTFNRGHLISGELESKLRSLAEQSQPDRGQTSSPNIVDKSLALSVHRALTVDPDLVIGKQNDLILIRSGDLEDREFQVTLERVICDEDGEPCDYEVIEAFGSTPESIERALSTYLKNGGDLSYISASI
jgi:hypothetical protein